MNPNNHIAYFSMEIALDSKMPTYSGGLGVLAGDALRSAADMKIPLIGVSLIHRKGYFVQEIDESGTQREISAEWKPEKFMEKMTPLAVVEIEDRKVKVQAWKYEIKGMSGFRLPVYFLDTNIEGNGEWDRSLSDSLYGGDDRYRLCQEILLGIGGVKILRVLGYQNITRFHMNEAHASLLTLELLEEEAHRNGRQRINHADVEAIKPKCVFTTHNPVAAVHDQFPMSLVIQVLGRKEVEDMEDVFCCEGVLNMTYLALNLSHYVNGAVRKPAKLTRKMFNHHRIGSITNGVHAATWTSPSFQKLFDRHIDGWREDNFSLRYVYNMPREEVWEAHCDAKKQLLKTVREKTGMQLDENICTLGFARRATAYNRADLIFDDIERLKKIASRIAKFQIIYSGKAHPKDRGGHEIIQHIYKMKELLKNDIKVIYLDNYDMELGRLLTAGVDVWLNTPQPPFEASGTSGMKAALNGVPSLSILDGWWSEGCIEGVTGWAIGDSEIEIETKEDRREDAKFLYDKLEFDVLPLFSRNPQRFMNIMRHTIALNASFFNTQRMMQQYVLKAYFL